MVAILSDNREFIIRAVKDMYTDVAGHPEKKFHFPTGRPACEFVGYPADELDAIPATAVESFAGVGYPHKSGFIGEGDIVLDIGSGSGTDALIAINVAPLEGNAEDIPLPDASIDVVTSNGVLNLVPDKAKAFREIARVLKPGGRAQIADIVVASQISDECRSNPQLWAECVVGASLEDSYLDLFAKAGLTDIKVLRRFDYFAGSNSEHTRKIAGSFDAASIEVTMRKP
jgi:ubiquinone/menaquinone biosynthesis C-methylase UbiE